MLFDLVTYKSYQGPRLDSDQQGSSSQSEAASIANQLQKIYTSAFRKKNANLLLSEIHEQIRSTDPEYTKKTFFSHKRRENEDSTAASSSAPSTAAAYVRPLPIAALMGDVNAVTVPEPDILELAEDDGDGGENTNF